MRARCLPILLALVALAAAPMRADEPKSIDLAPKWKKGDTVRYEMLGTQVREQDGKEVSQVATRTLVIVEVISAGAEGTVLRWTQGTTTFEDPDQDNDPVVKSVNTILKNTELDLELDDDGDFTGLRNWKAVRTAGTKVRDDVLAQMNKAGATKAAIDHVRQSTDQMLSTKETIEAAFTRNPLLLVKPLGKTYEFGTPIEYEGAILNPFGGEPFPAKGLCVIKLDKDKGIANISFKETTDPKDVTRIVQKQVDDVAKKTGTPAPNELPDVKLSAAAEYTVDVGTGWVNAVKHTRVTMVDKATQTDTVTLTRRAE